MSDILRFSYAAQTGLRAEVEAAMTAILSVHRVSDLPQIEVLFTAEDRFGGYMPETEEHLRTLSVSETGLTPRLTTVHEFGHFLDDAIGSFVTYASQEPTSPVFQVIAVAKRTQAIQHLREYEQLTRGTFSFERAQVINRLEEVEIWARAYAQYIAIRSGDVHLLAQVQARRDIEISVLKNEQWEWEDFASVVSAIDTLMQHLGWRS